MQADIVSSKSVITTNRTGYSSGSAERCCAAATDLGAMYSRVSHDEPMEGPGLLSNMLVYGTAGRKEA